MQRFFDKIEITDNCWNWKAAIRGNSGYGCIKYNKKLIDAHRLSWIIHNGEIPEGMCVCHSCDNRKCVNPNHLFLGTQSDNMKDCSIKGRLKIPTTGYFKIGHIAKNSLINKDRADEIRTIIKNKGEKKLIDIANELKIPYQLIRDINCNRVYK